MGVLIFKVVEIKTSRVFEIGRQQMHILISPVADGDKHRPVDRHGQNKPAIVIGMLPNQIDASRCTYNDIRFPTEMILKGFKYGVV